MSKLLFIVGGIAVLAGIVMAGFGIPISEFSFGNTLITAGATTGIGGLIVVGLGAVVSKLQQIADALGAQAYGNQMQGRASEAAEAADAFDAHGAPGAPAAGRVSFPSKPKAEPSARAARPLDARMPPLPRAVAEEETVKSVIPTLPNPDMAPVTVDDEVSLSPQDLMAAPAASDTDFGEPVRPVPPPFKMGEPKAGSRPVGAPKEPSLDSGWRPAVPPAPPAGAAPRRQPNAFFKAMWSAESKPAKSPSEAEPISEPTPAPPPPRNEAPVSAPPPPPAAEPELPTPPADSAPRTVAVLKSGVVDGMAYTLYVDGSIEAELPQGTLRFASINELRGHLEKNS